MLIRCNYIFHVFFNHTTTPNESVEKRIDLIKSLLRNIDITSDPRTSISARINSEMSYKLFTTVC